MKDLIKHNSPVTFFSGNHLSEEGLALAAEAMEQEYFDGLPDEIQDHLGECQECREGVSEIYQIIQQSGMQNEGHTGPFRPEGDGHPLAAHRLSWLKYAAVLLILVSALGYVWLRLANPEHPAILRVAAFLGIEYYDSFAPDPLVETLVGAIFREDGFQLLAPAASDTFAPGDFLQLQYTGYHSLSLHFELMNNRGEPALSDQVKGGAVILHLPDDPGLYYWRLSNGNELLFLGRLILTDSGNR